MSNDNSNSTIIFSREEANKLNNPADLVIRNACLLGLEGSVSGQIFDLPSGISTFGRNPENTFTIEAEGISRRHFLIEVTENNNETTVHIKDLGSSNGTYVSEKKVNSQLSNILQKNDKITAGKVAFRFIPKGDPDRLAYDKLAMAAHIDKLTESFNKAYFLEHLETEIKKSSRSGQPLTLIVLDLDFFKKLNDTYGHHAGDFVLRELSLLVKKQGLRDGDIFARYGGEEFVILLPKTNLKQGHEIAERIRKLIETHHFNYEGKKLTVTSSLGLADFRPGVVNGTDLFKRADKAVYQSKEKGRNQTNFFRD